MLQSLSRSTGFRGDLRVEGFNGLRRCENLRGKQEKTECFVIKGAERRVTVKTVFRCRVWRGFRTGARGERGALV